MRSVISAVASSALNWKLHRNDVDEEIEADFDVLPLIVLRSEVINKENLFRGALYVNVRYAVSSDV